MSSQQPPASSGRNRHRRTIHDTSIAALTVGSGIGVHFVDSSAPFVASAGVLAAAMVSRYTYGAEVDEVRDELRAVQAQLVALSAQVEADRTSGAQRLSWVAHVSHEIRSPLSAVVALGDMLKESALPPEQQSLVRDIQEAGHMVWGVVNDTLDLAKADSGQLMLVSRPFSLRALCERVGRLGQALAFGRQRPIQIIMARAPVDRVVGDELRLQRVLLNLISNAIKFSAAGHIEVDCRIEAEPADGSVLLRFSVTDQGLGLSEQDQAKLFAPYSRLGQSDRGPGGPRLWLASRTRGIRAAGAWKIA